MTKTTSQTILLNLTKIDRLNSSCLCEKLLKYVQTFTVISDFIETVPAFNQRYKRD